MKAIATLCILPDEQGAKIIAISPEANAWFVNREDLIGDMKALAEETEEGSQLSVLGILFGPGE